jgi:hypothetical protein
MDLMHLPWASYIINPRSEYGTSFTVGFLGLFVCLFFCAVCWYQIKN